MLMGLLVKRLSLAAALVAAIGCGGEGRIMMGEQG